MDRNGPCKSRSWLGYVISMIYGRSWPKLGAQVLRDTSGVAQAAASYPESEDIKSPFFGETRQVLPLQEPYEPPRGESSRLFTGKAAGRVSRLCALARASTVSRVLPFLSFKI